MFLQVYCFVFSKISTFLKINKTKKERARSKSIGFGENEILK